MSFHKTGGNMQGAASSPDVLLGDYIARKQRDEALTTAKPKLTFDAWVKKSAVHYHLAARDGDWSIERALKECWKAAQENV